MPATNCNSDESVYDSDAVELLECFAEGFDQMLCELAERRARSRASGDSATPTVTADDIVASAQEVLRVVDKSSLRQPARHNLGRMLALLARRSQAS